MRPLAFIQDFLLIAVLLLFGLIQLYLLWYPTSEQALQHLP